MTPFNRKKSIFCEEQLCRNVNKVDVVDNIQGIKTYGGVFYTIKDLTKKKILKIRTLKQNSAISYQNSPSCETVYCQDCLLISKLMTDSSLLFLRLCRGNFCAQHSLFSQVNQSIDLFGNNLSKR